jgi:hypothetical protein
MGPQPDFDFGDVLLAGQRPVRTGKPDDEDDAPDAAQPEIEAGQPATDRSEPDHQAETDSDQTEAEQKARHDEKSDQPT